MKIGSGHSKFVNGNGYGVYKETSTVSKGHKYKKGGSYGSDIMADELSILREEFHMFLAAHQGSKTPDEVFKKYTVLAEEKQARVKDDEADALDRLTQYVNS